MDYNLTDTQQEIVNIARELAEKKLKPVRAHSVEPRPWKRTRYALDARGSTACSAESYISSGLTTRVTRLN